MNMTPSQQAVIDSDSESLLILAGAGSGKTRVVIERIARLVSDGVPPESILFLTFTRKSAKEAKERLKVRLGESASKKIRAGTFHGISYGILKRFADRLGYRRDEDMEISVLLPEEKDFIMADICREFDYSGRKRDIADAFKHMAHRGEMPIDPELIRIVNEYRTRLMECNAIDYDMMLLEVSRLFHEHPDIQFRFHSTWKYVFVDEYQDTDLVQYNLHELIRPENIMVVGDADQNVYSWRGADLNVILGFQENKKADVIKLEECFRCPSNVVDAANKLISHNKKRLDKTLIPVLPSGEIIIYRELNKIVQDFEDMFFFEGNKTAVICRTHHLCKEAFEILSGNMIPCELLKPVDDSVETTADWKKFFAALRLHCNPNDNIAFLGWGRQFFGVDDARFLEIRKLANEIGTSYFKAYRKTENLPPTKPDYAETILNYVDGMACFDAIKAGPIKSYIESLGVGNLSPREFLEWIQTRDFQSSIEEKVQDKTLILTAHCSKGLEWDNVIIYGFNQGAFPSTIAMRRGDEALEEERRLAYVAITRARRRLFLVHTDKPSQFIEESGV